ncbi:MAG: winged helix-turn-helix domain-containing protein [Rhizomicrobium sp.]
MKAGPDIAPVAALIGDPARANMLSALLDGRALTAGELAREAGVTAQTASSHLAKLSQGGLVTPRRQGRHAYFALAGADVAALLESLMSLAARTGHSRTRPGPAEPALRRARVCYDHLAGDLGVALFDGLVARRLLLRQGAGLALSRRGADFMRAFGIGLDAASAARRPLCKDCLDWSARRSHLAGALGAALLARIFALGWARREPGSRAVAFTPPGLRAFERTFGPL